MTRTISLSKHLGVSREFLERNGIFDSVLGIDTKLFIDPKLLETTKIQELKHSRDKILSYFTKLITIIKSSKDSPRLQKTSIDMLAVPEPKGLAIGYGDKRDSGSAIPESLAKNIIFAALETIAVGIENPELIELLGLFVEKFGPDRMSDLISYIIYDDLCLFTHRISAELGFQVQEIEIDGIKFNLPIHPFRKDTPVILIPIEILRELPIATSWEEIDTVAKENQGIRDDWNVYTSKVIIDVISKLKDDNVNLERAKNNILELLEFYKNLSVPHYNLSTDNKGYYALSPFIDSQEGVFKKQEIEPKNGAELIEVVKSFLDQFKRSIEQNGGNNLLYHRTETGSVIPTKFHHEDVAQKLFYMLADTFCQRYNIMIAGESHAGRGPVDFSLGTGYDKKVLVEIKKGNNPNTADGFENQLQAYKDSENAIYGFYVVIELGCHTESNTNIQTLKKAYPTGKNKDGTSEIFYIDGRLYPSPSKL